MTTLGLVYDYERDRKRHELKQEGRACQSGHLPCLNRATVYLTSYLKTGEPIRTVRMCPYHLKRYSSIANRGNAPHFTTEPI